MTGVLLWAVLQGDCAGDFGPGGDRVVCGAGQHISARLLCPLGESAQV